MPLKTAATIDEVPEALRASAVELKDGGFGYAEDPDTKALDNTNRAVRQERDEWKVQAKQAAEELADVKRQLEAKVAATGDIDKNMTATLEKWNNEKAAEIAKLKAELAQQYQPYVEKLTVYELDNVLGDAFLSAGGREERKARAIAQAKLEGWTLVDGKAVRKTGEQIESTTPVEFFTKPFREDVPEWYKGTQAAGGGAAGNTATMAASASAKPPTQWSSDERRSFIESNGPEAYRGLLDAQIRDGVKGKAA